MPIKWRKVQISAEAFESANAFDVDGDGILDIVSGGYWYKGPDFRQKIVIADNLRRYDDYYDDFSTIPMDIAGFFHKMVHVNETNGTPIYIRGRVPGT